MLAILTSKLSGVDTTDLVSTSTFSSPIITTRYGNISLLLTEGTTPNMEQMEMLMRRDATTVTTADRANPHLDFTCRYNMIG
mgnify:CR=1 FL=1